MEIDFVWMVYAKCLEIFVNYCIQLQFSTILLIKNCEISLTVYENLKKSFCISVCAR